MKELDVQQKYEAFLEIYEQGVKKHVPLYIEKEKRKERKVYCKVCKGKTEKGYSMEKITKKKIQSNRTEYGVAMNE